jgi:Ca2+-binding RTX toxin-like protein
MTTTASMSQRLGTLVITGDDIVVGRTATGDLLVDDGATRIKGGKSDLGNTDLVLVLGSSADDQVGVDLSDGALPLVDLVAGAGQDTLALFGGAGSETFEVTGANGLLNVAAMSIAGSLGRVRASGVETLVIEPGAGGDEVLVGDLSGSGVGGVEVRFGSDGASDILGVAGTAAGDGIVVTVAGGQATVSGASVAIVASGVEAADRFFVDGGDGADLIDASAIAQRADMLGGAGADTLLGGAGNDVLQSMDGNDVVAGGGGDDFVSLADGDDRAIWAVGDGSDNVSGGAGSDRLEMTGSAGADVFSLLVSGGGVIASHGGLVTNLNVNGFETISIAAGTGADSIAVGALAGAGVQRVEIDLGSDGAADVLQIAGIAGGPVAVGGALVYTTSGGLQVVVTGFVDGVDQILPLFG